MFRRILGGIGVAVLAVAGLAALGTRDRAIAGGPVPTTVPITAPTTTVPSTTTTKPDRGVVALQQRLAALGYDVGAADGAVGQRTRFAITAFQKVQGLQRTGEPSAEVTAALATASKPRAMVPNGEATRVEISLRRQLLLFWRNGVLTRVLPVSTGSGKTYCVNGTCERAVTPTGTFRIERKMPGTDDGPLGRLYSPMYFHNGVAIHGAPSVPSYPASHGCARIPMYASTSFFQQVPLGTAVYVIAG